MKKLFLLKYITLLSLCLFVLSPTWTIAEESTPEQQNIDISKRMVSIIKAHEINLQKWVKDERIIQAVKAHNKQNLSLAYIKELDQAWINGEAQELVMAVQQNDTALYLKKRVENNKRLYVEAFLCDEQGAVVAEYPKTSDYWQGDEDKFIESFNNGHGKNRIGALKFDESTKTYSVQISIPVIDEGKTIGVLIVGLKNI
ncbi:MAG: hypothetical protein Q9M09_01170 [Mariprofundaceae bacterium]|nr:hypothetical protein [Mariprofundaceae bacterium]